MCSIWSTKICFVSNSSRPISVDLPSSTEPHVTRRRSSAACACSEMALTQVPPRARAWCLEWALKIADTLAVLHRGFGEAVVGAGLAALGDTRRGDLVDDLRDRRRVADDAAGAGHVTDGAETHRGGEEILAVHALDVVRARAEHAVAPE